MTTIKDRFRPGLSANQWRQLKKKFKARGIDWNTQIPGPVDISLQELLDEGDRRR